MAINYDTTAEVNDSMAQNPELSTGGTVTDPATATAEEFNFPPEFESDVPQGRIHNTDGLPPSSAVGQRNSTTVYQPTGSGLDALAGMEFDQAQDEQERKKLDAPTGDWQKEDRWEFELYIRTEDSQPGDKNPAGRTYFNFKGKPHSREANDLVYEPTLFLRMSPDRRYKEDKPQEVDMAHKLYLLAKDVYLELKEEAATDPRKFVTMLIEDSYVVRTMNGDGGPIVVAIKSGRRRNRR